MLSDISTYIHHNHVRYNKFTKDKSCGLKDNTGMGLCVQVEITRRKRGFNRQVQKMLLCNGPSITTPKKPLIVRNCFKLYIFCIYLQFKEPNLFFLKQYTHLLPVVNCCFFNSSLITCKSLFLRSHTPLMRSWLLSSIQKCFNRVP